MKEMMNVHAAKTNFSKLLARVANGEEIVIARDGIPVARLVKFEEPTARPLGIYAGEIWIADDAFERSDVMADLFEAGEGVAAPRARGRKRAPS